MSVSVQFPSNENINEHLILPSSKPQIYFQLYPTCYNDSKRFNSRRFICLFVRQFSNSKPSEPVFVLSLNSPSNCVISEVISPVEPIHWSCEFSAWTQFISKYVTVGSRTLWVWITYMMTVYLRLRRHWKYRTCIWLCCYQLGIFGVLR